MCYIQLVQMVWFLHNNICVSLFVNDLLYIVCDLHRYRRFPFRRDSCSRIQNQSPGNGANSWKHTCDVYSRFVLRYGRALCTSAVARSPNLPCLSSPRSFVKECSRTASMVPVNYSVSSPYTTTLLVITETLLYTLIYLIIINLLLFTMFYCFDS